MRIRWTIDNHAVFLIVISSLLSVGVFGSAPARAAYTKANSGVFSDHIYEVWMKDSGRLTWSEAQSYASSVLGGNLASINSQDENLFIAGLITDPSLFSDSKSPEFNYIGPYIGLVRTGPTTPPFNPTVGWNWLDGSSLLKSNYLWTNWFAAGTSYGQPDGWNGDSVGVYYNATNGLQGPWGMPGRPVTTWGDVVDGLKISYGPGAPGPNPFLSNSFVIEKVPGPLPVAGCMVAFNFSRRIRRRHRVS